MEEIEKKLNEYMGGLFDFKFKSAELDKQSLVCYVEFLYKDGVILSAENRTKAEEFVKQHLPKNFEYQVKFVKNFLINDSLEEELKSFMKKNFPAILYSIKKLNCEDGNNNIIIGIAADIKEYIETRNVKAEIEKHFNESYSSKIIVDFVVDGSLENVVVQEEEIDFNVSLTPANRTIEVSEVEPVVGELTETQAFYIKDKKQPDDVVVFCGNIQFIKEYSYTPKRKPKDEEENKEETVKAEEKDNSAKDSASGEEKQEDNPTKGERKYFKFVLQDFTDKISCVFFANKNNYEKMLTLQSKQPVIIEGKLELDKFSGGVSMRVKNISKCILPEKFEEEIVYKPEPKNYRFVFPEKHEQYMQADLFAFEEKQPSEFLKNNKVVVFDFETTGLDLTGNDKIIEIGAVKVEEGKITERFSSFVDPQVKISAESTRLTGITDEDVKGAPTYDQMLADFYKFTRGCYLSGYNIIGFDCFFLYVFGKKSGYKFDNDLIDVYKIAQKEVHGVKNYKLGTIADKLGVVLDNAHRAIYDTIATAEVLLELDKMCDISESVVKFE